MTRYFFHIRSGTDLLDEIGVELPDLEAVRTELLAACGELLKEADDAVRDRRSWHMQVVDETGREVIRFTGAVVESHTAGAA